MLGRPRIDFFPHGRGRRNGENVRVVVGSVSNVCHGPVSIDALHFATGQAAKDLWRRCCGCCHCRLGGLDSVLEFLGVVHRGRGSCRRYASCFHDDAEIRLAVFRSMDFWLGGRRSSSLCVATEHLVRVFHTGQKMRVRIQRTEEVYLLLSLTVNDYFICWPLLTSAVRAFTSPAGRRVASSYRL